jgi:seryl-tRNA(Sec) selenium transferase
MDKLTLAALEAVLRIYAAGDWQTLPALRALTEPLSEVRQKAENLSRMLAEAGIKNYTGPHAAVPGGGAKPGETIESPAGFIPVDGNVNEGEQALRRQLWPVLALVHKNELVFNMRTVSSAEVPLLFQSITKAFAARSISSASLK